MNVQGLTRNMWGTEADTLSPLLSGLHLRCADVVCLQELGLLNSDIPELQSRCKAAGYTAFVAPLHHPDPAPHAIAPTTPERRVLGRGTLLLIRNELAKYAAPVPCFISHRAIAIRLLIHNVCRLHILGIYAPTGSSAEVAVERRNVLAGIRAFSAAADAASVKLIVLGDLNEVADPLLDASPAIAPRSTPLIDLLRGSLSLSDSFRGVHPQTVAVTWCPSGSTSCAARRLDYIFLSRGVIVSSASVEHTNPLISTDHGVVSCSISLSNPLPSVAVLQRETLLDPGRTRDWGIAGRASWIRFSSSPTLTQASWNSLVHHLTAFVDPPCESHSIGDIYTVRHLARTSLSFSKPVAAGTVEVCVDYDIKNAAVIALITTLTRTFDLDGVSHNVSAVTTSGWAAFARAMTSEPIISRGLEALRALEAASGLDSPSDSVSAAMGTAFSALTETLVAIASPLIATRQTGTACHTRPIKQTSRLKLQSQLRIILALLPKPGLPRPTSAALRSAREHCRNKPAVRQSVRKPPAIAACDVCWAIFRDDISAVHRKVSVSIKEVGAVERKANTQFTSKQRHADFKARRFRNFLDAAEERTKPGGGIVSVTVPDAAGHPSTSTDPFTVKRVTRDFMHAWTQPRGMPPADFDVIGGPAAMIHTSALFRAAHPEVAAALKPLSWVKAEWYEGLRAEPTAVEFDQLLEQAPSGTAPGPSQISYDILKQLPKGPWRDIVWKLVCIALRHCILPPAIKLASIWLIPKTAEPNPPPERRRPISLLETLFKLIEALPVKRLRRALAVHHILCPLQYGFSDGGNTTAPLTILAAAIAHAVETDADLDVVLVDSKQAFDRPPPWAQRASLARICLPERDVDFFMGLQAQAMSIVQTAFGPTEPYLVEAGYRQGSLNGPNGFNIFQDILVSMQAQTPEGYVFPTHPHPRSICDAPNCSHSDVTTAVPILAYVDDVTKLAIGSAAINKLVSAQVKFGDAFNGELHPVKSEYSFRRSGWTVADYENHASLYARYCSLRDTGLSQSAARAEVEQNWDFGRLRDFPLPPFADSANNVHLNLCPSFQAMRSLGCWFSLDGRTVHQERILREVVDLFCARAVRKRHSIAEIRYLLSAVLHPKVVYPARVQLPPPKLLAELDSKVAVAVIKSCGLSRSTAHATIFSSDGLGMPRIATAVTAAAIDDMLTLINDDWEAETLVMGAETALQSSDSAETQNSLQRAQRSAALLRIPQTALASRLQSLAKLLSIPGNPLSYPFHKSMWRTIKSPFIARVWEALSNSGYEVNSRLPSLLNDDRRMIADVITPSQYHKLAPILTKLESPADASLPPVQPLWTVSDVVRADGLGMKHHSTLTGSVQHNRRHSGHVTPLKMRKAPPAWFTSLQLYLQSSSLRNPNVNCPNTNARIEKLQPGEWQVALDRSVYVIGDVVCYCGRTADQVAFSLRVFIVRQIEAGGTIAGLTELISTRGHNQWRTLPDGESPPLPLPGSLRDVGPLPTLTGINVTPDCLHLQLIWIHGTELIPLVGGWDTTDEESEDCQWLTPHPIAWLKHAYNNELARRSESQLRAAAGDKHPCRRIRAVLLANSATDVLPPPVLHPACQLSPLQLAAPIPAQLRVSCAGAAFQDSEALGAAVTYYAKPCSANGREALRVELAMRLDPGAKGPRTANASYRTHLHSFALALQVAAALRASASEVLITVNSPAISDRAFSLRSAPIGRRRLAQNDPDACNIIRSYFALQHQHNLPKLLMTYEAGGAVLCATRRADTAAHVELSTLRDYPIGSEWCILEYNGERVNERAIQHVQFTLSAQSTSSWRQLAKQGQVARHAPMPLPASRRTALARAGNPGVAKSAFRSITHTHVTQHELHQWFPSLHPTDGCILPGCNPTTPDSQDHVLLECPAMATERAALVSNLSSMLRSLCPQRSSYWLALTSGDCVGPDTLRVTTLAAFATTAVVAVNVAGSSLALIRNTPDPQSPPLQQSLGAAIRVGDPHPAGNRMSITEILEWCSTAKHNGTWVAIPEQVLLDLVFRWQSVVANDLHALRPDALLTAIADTALLPNYGSAPGWSTLHTTVANIFMDSLQVKACASVGALTTQRRSAPTLLAPGAYVTPLDTLVGCRSWSPSALHDTVVDHGLLIVLPPRCTSQVYAALGKLDITHGRCVVLVPWGAHPTLPTPRDFQKQRESGVASLLSAGYVAAAIIPAAWTPLSRLESPGPGVHTLSSFTSDYNHLLLSSWRTTPKQMATLLTALCAFAELRGCSATGRETSAPVLSPLLQPPPWRIEGIVNHDLITLPHATIAKASISHVIGSLEHVHSTLSQAATLRALRPEEFLFPNLLRAVPPDDVQDPQYSHPTPYVGASLDDEYQPPPSESCKWLSATTLQTIASGIIPEAITSVISHWIARHCMSAVPSQPSLSLRRPRPAAAAAQQSATGAQQSTLDTIMSPQPHIELRPQPASQLSNEDTRSMNASTLAVSLIQSSSLIWKRRNTLLALHHKNLGLPPSHWRRGAPPRKPADHLPMPTGTARSDLPPSNLSHGISPAESRDPPQTTARRVRIALPHHGATSSDSPETASIPHNPQPTPPGGRVSHPGRDPTEAELPPAHHE